MNIISRLLACRRDWFDPCERSFTRLCNLLQLSSYPLRGESIWLVLLVFIALFLTSCGEFDGPWTFYPEDSVAYRGVYTHGYVVAGQKPYVCFSKLYSLDESASENFAFYDSASVFVFGKFSSGDTLVELSSVSNKPNCFDSDKEAFGVAGESYMLKATFKWDSAGSTVLTRYSGVAKIPTKLSAVTVTPPGKNVISDQKPVANKHEYLKFEFQEYPRDLYTYNIAMDYDSSVQGMLMTLAYNASSDSSGESMNTTIFKMLKSFVEKDSVGYYGWTMHDAFEKTQSLGFEARLKIGDFYNLDTMYLMGVQLPIGKSTVKIYAVDQAYADYQNYLLESFEDSRVAPRTNIENGNGVFAGMLVDSVRFDICSDNAISYSYAKVYECANHQNEDGKDDPWNTKSCRLFQEEFCKGSLNMVKQTQTCYPVAVKLAMLHDSSSWSVYLPDTISEESKSKAYADGLKRYCVSNNFKSTPIADCGKIYEECQVSLDSNSCKDYIWKWCSDRDWDLATYPQCGTALVSEFYYKQLNSNILQRVVDLWCKENENDPQCKRE